MGKILFSCALFISFFFNSNCVSQTLTRQFIDSAFHSTSKDFKISRGVFYVIDGSPYDSVTVDSVLRKYVVTDIIGLSFLSCEKAMFCHCVSDIAIVSFVYPQNRKTKRKELQKALEFYNRCLWPVVSIDNHVLGSDNSEKILRSLKLKDIKYIETAEGEFPQVKVWLMRK